MLSRTALSIHQQALSRTNVVSQRIMYRTMHITCRIQNIGVKSRSLVKISKYYPVLSAKRYSSTTDAANAFAAPITSTIPENPIESTAKNTITSTGENTISSTGESTIASTGENWISSAADTTIANTSDVSGASIAEGLTSKLLDTIPDAPLPPAQTVLDVVTYIGEPPFSALGLGGWSPVGIIQQGLELLHVSCGLPWWESIAIGTLVLRFLLFPLVIVAQRNGARMSNNMPELTRLQTEMQEARVNGDQLKCARKSQELMKFMKEKQCSPIKNMLVPLAQGPIFVCVFLGLRRMAELPVESMKEGGLWWFADLTVADPYYILPMITTATLSLTVEIGTDSMKAQAMGGIMRYVFRAVPLIIFPFTLHFPAAVLCYWVSANFISLIQVGVLRIPKVRKFFDIEPMVQHSAAAKAHQKGFVEGFKSAYQNMKTAREMNSRFEVDEVQFNRAGRGPLQKTYSYDPTKQTVNKAKAVLAKKR